MLKRSLFFSNPFHLSTKDQQLLIKEKETGELIRSASIEDLGFVVIDHPQISIGSSLLQRLSENNVAVIFCDDKHHPSSMLLHLDTHHIQAERFREQIAASEPLRKQLWQQTVKAKILNQAEVLESTGAEAAYLKSLTARVTSGDSTNMEGQASRAYWQLLFGRNFRRERYGMPPNPSLNYGYAIIRAGVARALAGTGLLPTLGIHHHNKYNSFALADDIMEPYRPFVDLLVWKQKQSVDDYHNIHKERKAEFVSLLSSDALMNKERSPMMIAMQTTAASLAKCFAGTTKKINYPSLPF
jgi:CRISP-associated protein Cas1